MSCGAQVVDGADIAQAPTCGNLVALYCKILLNILLDSLLFSLQQQ